MSKSSNKLWSRTGLLAGVSIAAVGAAPQASAITVNSLNLSTVSDSGATACSIAADYQVIANANDGSNIDRFHFALTYADGTPIPVGTSSQTNFSSALMTSLTRTDTQTLELDGVAGQITEDIYFTIFEATAPFPSSRTGIAGQVLIPQSTLQSVTNCQQAFINHAPVANGDAPSQVAGGTPGVSLSGLLSSDPDGDPITYSWSQLSGPTVTLSNPTTNAASFDAPPKLATDQTLVFELTVTDVYGLTATDQVSILVPANIGPTVNAGPDANAAGSSAVTLDGTGTSDGDGDTLTYAWTQLSGTGVTLAGANTTTPSFTAPPKLATAQPLVFQLTADDGIQAVSDDVQITVPANISPIASIASSVLTAGSGATVTLDASASTDPDNDALTITWTQTSGATLPLTNPNSLTPTLTVPTITSPSTVTYDLVISDGIASTAPQTVTVNLVPNAPPVAYAGPDKLIPGDTQVTVNGSATDPESDPLTYQWTQASGPAVTLTGATTPTLVLTTPTKTASAQTLVFDLVVTDTFSNTATDSMQITVPANIAPIADASGPAQVAGGSTVTLDSANSYDDDQDTLTYSWVQLSGTPVTLAGPTTAQPTFTAPARTSANQPLVFELTVDDGFGATSTAQITVTVPANGVPVASAGPDQTVAGSALVTLDASGTTDLENDPLTYLWTQTAGPAVSLSSASAINPTFTAPAKQAANQTLTFSLTADDGIDTSLADTVDILVPANIAPTSDAGADITASGGATVTLDGTASADGDNDAITYTWTQTAGPAVTLSDASAASPTFVAPLGGTSVQTLTFELVVNDGIASAAADTVSVSISPNSVPIADAGADQGPIDSGQTVTLTGAGSSDPDGNTLTYTWTQLSGPTATLSDAHAASPTFTAPLVNVNEDLVFQLVVNDAVTDSAPDTVTISVRAVGSVRIIHRVVGPDADITFTSDVAGLSGTVTSTNGAAELVATAIPAGAHTISASDLSAMGYALTGISCTDTDSVIDVPSRSISLSLSPGEDLTCTFTSTDTRSAAAVAIKNFLSGRNALLLANQPDSGRRIGRLEGANSTTGQIAVAGFAVPGAGALPLSLSINETGGQFSTSLSKMRLNSEKVDPERGPSPFDVWAEATLGTAKFGTNSNNYTIAYLGADYLINDQLLAGVLGEYDDLSRKGSLKPGDAEGTGWMIGPYATAKLGPGLYADIRAAWGTSDNRVSPLGTYVDAFKTRRSLYSGSLVGVYDLNDHMRFRPEVSLDYIAEDQKAYTDKFGVTIPGQTVDQGALGFSPRLDYLVSLDNGWKLSPFVSGDGIYTFGTSDTSGLSNGLRARFEVGTGIYRSGGLRVDFTLNHDGIGESDYSSTGAMIALSRAF